MNPIDLLSQLYETGYKNLSYAQLEAKVAEIFAPLSPADAKALASQFAGGSKYGITSKATAIQKTHRTIEQLKASVDRTDFRDVPERHADGGEVGDKELGGLPRPVGAKPTKEERKHDRRIARQAFRDNVLSTFGEAAEINGDEAVIKDAGRTIYLEYRPEDKSVFVDFVQGKYPEVVSEKQHGSTGWDTTGKDLQKGTVGLLHKFQQFIKGTGEHGLKIDYETTDDRRNKLYAKALSGAGFEKIAGDDPEAHSWRPKAAAELAHGGPIPKAAPPSGQRPPLAATADFGTNLRPMKIPFAKGGQVESDAFKKWFGDSKVVDEDGKPKRVFHGLSNDTPEFDSFNTMGGRDFGSHFGSIDQASEFAGKSGRVAPTFLNLKNPLRLPDLNQWDFATISKAAKERGVDIPKPATEGMKHLDARKIEREALRSGLEAAGHDGIVYRNQVEGNKTEDAYIAFRPEQIKSAIGNSGAYDPNDQHIGHAEGGPIRKVPFAKGYADGGNIEPGSFVIRKPAAEALGPEGAAQLNAKQVPGSGDGDTVPAKIEGGGDALLTPKELVVPKEKAQQLGPEKMEQLNHAEKFGIGGGIKKAASAAAGAVGHGVKRAASFVGNAAASLGTMGAGLPPGAVSSVTEPAKQRLSDLEDKHGFAGMAGIAGLGEAATWGAAAAGFPVVPAAATMTAISYLAPKKKEFSEHAPGRPNLAPEFATGGEVGGPPKAKDAGRVFVQRIGKDYGVFRGHVAGGQMGSQGIEVFGSKEEADALAAQMNGDPAPAKAKTELPSNYLTGKPGRADVVAAPQHSADTEIPDGLLKEHKTTEQAFRLLPPGVQKIFIDEYNAHYPPKAAKVKAAPPLAATPAPPPAKTTARPTMTAKTPAKATMLETVATPVSSPTTVKTPAAATMLETVATPVPDAPPSARRAAKIDRPSPAQPAPVDDDAPEPLKSTGRLVAEHLAPGWTSMHDHYAQPAAKKAQEKYQAKQAKKVKQASQAPHAAPPPRARDDDDDDEAPEMKSTGRLVAEHLMPGWVGLYDHYNQTGKKAELARHERRKKRRGQPPLASEQDDSKPSPASSDPTRTQVGASPTEPTLLGSGGGDAGGGQDGLAELLREISGKLDKVIDAVKAGKDAGMGQAPGSFGPSSGGLPKHALPKVEPLQRSPPRLSEMFSRK